jgi:hypothetical protein
VVRDLSERGVPGQRFLPVALLVIAACTSVKDGPGSLSARSTVSNYIAKTFQVRSVADKAALEEYLTGEARQRLNAWNDEQFLVAFSDSKRKFEKLQFREVEALNENEVNVTYELTFVERKDRESRTTTKKMAHVVLRDGRWLIENVRNIKLLVEYQDEMSLP